MKQNPLSGKKFGYLTIIKKDEYSPLWIAVCRCGNMIKRPYHALKKGRHKTCGSKLCTKLFKSISPQLAVVNLAYHYYKKGARSRNLVFKLKKNEFEKLILNNCYYCGSAPQIMDYGKKHNIKTNGVDRINNTVGYINSNVRSCCPTCNKIKLNFTEKVFLAKVKQICTFHKDASCQVQSTGP